MSAWVLLLGLILSCGSSSPEEPFLLLDTRSSGTDQERIPVSSKVQTFWMISFSSGKNFTPPQYGYQIQLEPKTNSTSSNSLRSLQHLPKPSFDASMQKLSDRIFEENIRNQKFQDQIEEAFENLRRQPQLFQRLSTSSNQTRALQENTLTLFSPFEGETNQEIQGTLRASSSSAEIYVDSRINPTVSDTDVKSLLETYEEVSLPRLQSLFGDVSDIDQNQVVQIFISSPEKLGTNVLGFFRPLDLLPDGSVHGIRSNESEIIYIRTPHPENFSKELANATMAHETYHLINFSQKTLPSFTQSNGLLVISETLFLNEGLAHLAEELTGWGVSTPALVKIYLECLEFSSLAGSGNATVDYPCAVLPQSDDSLPRRGGMMLFLLYLFQQMGGATYSPTLAGDISGSGVDFLQTLTQSKNVGISNIEKASGKDFFTLYKSFVSMLALDKTSQNSDSRFNLWEEEKDPFTQQVRNVRLRGTRTNSEGTVTLNGPKVLQEVEGTKTETLERSLYVSGANSFKTSIPAGSDFQISLKAETNLGLGMVLIPIQE